MQMVVSMMVGNCIILRASQSASSGINNSCRSNAENASRASSDGAKTVSAEEVGSSVLMFSVKMIMADEYSYNFGML